MALIIERQSVTLNPNAATSASTPIPVSSPSSQPSSLTVDRFVGAAKKTLANIENAYHSPEGQAFVAQVKARVEAQQAQKNAEQAEWDAKPWYQKGAEMFVSAASAPIGCSVGSSKQPLTPIKMTQAGQAIDQYRFPLAYSINQYEESQSQLNGQYRLDSIGKSSPKVDSVVINAFANPKDGKALAKFIHGGEAYVRVYLIQRSTGESSENNVLVKVSDLPEELQVTIEHLESQDKVLILKKS